MTEQDWQARAAPALYRIFRTLDAYGEPFRDDVERRLLVSVDGFFLTEEQYQAVCAAASAQGDTTLFYSIARSYLGGSELMPYYSWEIPAFDYQSYYEADEGCRIEGPKDIGIPLDRVLYSPSGSWGILLPELFVLIGGPAPFVEAFKAGYKGWRDDLDRFMLERAEAKRERGADVNWVPKLLRHIYGEGAPEFSP